MGQGNRKCSHAVLGTDSRPSPILAVSVRLGSVRPGIPGMPSYTAPKTTASLAHPRFDERRDSPE